MHYSIHTDKYWVSIPLGFGLLAGLIALLPALALAITPVAPINVQLSQPNGYQFSARPKGNDYVHWMETTDGYSIIEVNGEWFYADLNSAGELVSSGETVSASGPTLPNTSAQASGSVQAGPALGGSALARPKHLRPTVDTSQFPRYQPPPERAHYANQLTNRRYVSLDTPISVTSQGAGFQGAGPSTHPSTNQPVLVLMVAFSDRAFTYSAANIETMMFGTNDSVKDYFDEVSYNSFNVQAATETQGTANDGIIQVTLGYNHPNVGNAHGASTRAIVTDALTAANSYINFASYDSNADGTLSAAELSILVITSGYENAYGGASAPTPRIWAHKWNIATTAYDGVDLSAYAMVGEIHTDHMLTIGIVCHELGHLFFGLPDLYDRDSSSAGIGTWGVMAGGNWNYDTGEYSGESPANFLAYNKILAGFAQVNEVTASGTYNLGLSLSDNIYRVTTDKYQMGEYFLVEKRRQTGTDVGLAAGGLLITHVDPDVITQNDNENHKLVDVEAADGATHMDSNTNSGDAGDIWPGSITNRNFNDSSSPNSKNYSNAATNIAIESIGDDSASATAATFTTVTTDLGGNFGYDNGYQGVYQNYGTTSLWTAQQFTNAHPNSSLDTLDGIEVYVDQLATVSVYEGSSLSSSGVIGSLTAIPVSSHSKVNGWNRLLFTTPMAMANGASKILVLHIQSDSSSTVNAMQGSNISNTGWFYWRYNATNNTSTGSESFTASSYNLNQRLLLSGTVANVAPTITGYTGSTTVAEDNTLTINLSDVSVTDGDNSFPADFTLSVLSGSNYSVSSNQITPTANYNGALTVPIRVNDGTDDSNIYNLAVTVSAVNDAPVITGQASLATLKNTPITLGLSDLVVTDVDNSYPSGFSLSVSSGANYSLSGQQVTPASEYTGSLSVPVQVNDGAANSASYNVMITVTADASPNITGQNSVTIDEDTSYSFDLNALTVVDADSTFPGSFTFSLGTGDNYSIEGTSVVPEANYHGTLSVPVVVNDGSNASNSYNFNLQVNSINDAPVISGQQTMSMSQGSSISLTLEQLEVSDADHNNAELSLILLEGGNYSTSGNQITPAADFTGTLTVQLKVTDGSAETEIYNAAIEVTSNDNNTRDVVTESFDEGGGGGGSLSMGYLLLWIAALGVHRRRQNACQGPQIHKS